MSPHPFLGAMHPAGHGVFTSGRPRATPPPPHLHADLTSLPLLAWLVCLLFLPLIYGQGGRQPLEWKLPINKKTNDNNH